MRRTQRLSKHPEIEEGRRMWTSLWTWVKANKVLAAVFAIVSLVAISSVADGWSARNAARRYFDLIKGWQTAYNRDTAASKKEYEAKVRVLTADRDTYRKKWEAAKGKMGAPWTPPKGAKALQGRFNKLGYRGNLR